MLLPQPPLDATALAAMQRRFRDGLAARLDRLFAAEPLDAERREALTVVLLAAARQNHEVSDAQLTRLSQRAPPAIHAAAARIPELLPRRAQALVERAARERPDGRYDAAFGSVDRLFLPLPRPDGVGAVEARVAARLAAEGYAIADYAAGKATDAAGKQSFRIGKLLARMDDGLYRDFQHDGARSGEGLLLCLSRLPMDIARVSTGRGWHSCMAYGDVFFDHVAHDIREGSLVAYLVGARDPEVLAPLARILLKPFDNQDGVRLLVPAKVYGLANDRFERGVEAVARSLAAGLPEGIYRLRGEAYRDDLGERTLLLHDPVTAEKLLDAVDCPWERRRDGRIHTLGDLRLSDCNLRRLPDLTGVVVHGDFTCARNLLTSLQGMPQEVDGDISVALNRLTSLAGMPRLVQGSFDCRNNRLASLQGGPRTVFGDMNCQDNALATLEGGPAEVGRSYNCSCNALTALTGAPRIVTGDFYCAGNLLVTLQGAPVRVDGHFAPARNRLESLDGGPRYVGGNFTVIDNRLRDLTHAPGRIDGQLHCVNNPLQSLVGAPDARGGLTTPFGKFARLAEVATALRRPAAPRRHLRPVP